MLSIDRTSPSQNRLSTPFTDDSKTKTQRSYAMAEYVKTRRKSPIKPAAGDLKMREMLPDESS